MKKILVGTDFSEASHNAALYAIKIAEAFHAQLVLFHAYHPAVVPITDESASIGHVDLEKSARERLENEMVVMNPTASVISTIDCMEALPADGILYAVDNHAADLVVIGLKQTGRGLRKAFGSTATKLARRSRVPVIVVPETTHPKRISTLVLAYDGDFNPGDSTHVLDMVKQLGYRFNAKVYLVHVAETELQEVYHVLNNPFRLTRMMGKLPAVSETLRSKNIPGAIGSFIKEHHADLLAILPEKKNLLKHLLRGSTTNRIMFESNVPLLLLPGFHEGGGRWWKRSKRDVLKH